MAEIEGIKAVSELTKETKGWKAGLSLIVLIVLVALSLFEAFKKFNMYGERDIVFSGTVYNNKGSRVEGVLVILEGFPNLTKVTDSEGQFIIRVKNTELKSPSVTLSFENPKRKTRVTRNKLCNDAFTSDIDIIMP